MTGIVTACLLNINVTLKNKWVLKGKPCIQDLTRPVVNPFSRNRHDGPLLEDTHPSGRKAAVTHILIHHLHRAMVGHLRLTKQFLTASVHPGQCRCRHLQTPTGFKQGLMCAEDANGVLGFTIRNSQSKQFAPMADAVFEQTAAQVGFDH